jgi:hypothetical protein
VLPVAADSLSYRLREQSRIISKQSVPNAHGDAELGDDLQHVWPLL